MKLRFFSSLFQKRNLFIFLGGFLLLGGVNAALPFFYDWEESPEEIVRQALLKDLFEGEDWRRSLFASISGSMHNIDWISCAENDGGNRPYERGAISVQYVSNKGDQRQHTFSDRNYSLNGEKGIIEFYCVEEIPWVTFYECETSENGVCQSKEEAKISLLVETSNDGETFTKSASLSPEDSYLSVFTPAYFRVTVKNSGSVSGDAKILFLSDTQDRAGVPKNEEVWCEGAESCTGTPSKGSVVLKGIPPGGEAFIDYERDMSPVSEETLYTEQVQLDGEAEWQKVEITLLPTTEPSNEEYSPNTENIDEISFQFSASEDRETFAEKLSIPAEDSYLDIFTPITFRVEIQNTSEEILSGEVLLDVQDNNTSSEWKSARIACEPESTCEISPDTEMAKLENIAPDSSVTLEYERDIRPSENLEHVETLFFDGLERATVTVSTE